MAKLNIKKGDNVLILTGKEIGKTGEVLECFPQEKKVIVKGVNIVVKHNKPKSAQNKGGIVKKEGKLEISNVMVVCPICNKATKIKIGLNEKGEKVRICKKCGAVLDGAVKVLPKKSSAKASVKTEASDNEVSENVENTKKSNVAPSSTHKKSELNSTKTTKVAKTVRATAPRKTSPAKKVGGK